ncbi:hypothetical protein UFOVP1150_45, partial [uncultured Caudovirales phage]
LSRGEGLPADYLNSDDTVTKLREARAQAQQAEQEREMMMQAAKSKPLVDAAMQAGGQQQ